MLLYIDAAAALHQSTPIDSLITQLNSYTKTDSVKVNLLNRIGNEYWIIDADESIRFGKRALQLSEELAYTGGLARANRVIGVAYWSQGVQNKALKYLKASYELYDRLQDKTGIANTRLNLGMVYADLKNYQKALQYYESAINEFTALELKDRIATTFTKIGTMFVEQHRETEALKFLTDALQMHSENDFTYGIAEVHNKLGILYLNKNEIEQASYHTRKSMSLGEEVNDIHGRTHNLIILGKILRLSNKIDKAIVYVQQGLVLAKENNLKQFELLAYEELKELKQQKGELYEALCFYDNYTFLKDSLFNSEKSKQIAFLEFENELDKKDAELLEFKAQEKASNTIKIILLIGIVILAIAGYIIYFVSKQRLGKSKQLAVKTKEHLESAQELTQKHLENSELRRKELKQQLDFKNRELTSYALNFIKKNEVVQELECTISDLKQSSAISKDKLIADLKKIIQKNLSIDKDWENFSRFFDDVHQGFYSNLKSKHKGLTANDLKLCSLIRLNLNTKETASILGISPESAKTSRYRLRKKLELSSGEEISTYLLSLE
ncbi:tetratricopeptide repeat protein [Spongiimicrobium salis]|uniref:tetratricopeptide repeat protein n=1 Tax=Spongiimicrobium salis TaxID=1667022 RepID=UPI00374D565F